MTRLSFHDLGPGQHRIRVALAANDHVALGRERVLALSIPKQVAARRAAGGTRP